MTLPTSLNCPTSCNAWSSSNSSRAPRTVAAAYGAWMSAAASHLSPHGAEMHRNSNTCEGARRRTAAILRCGLEGGFSLLELILVVTLIAIISSAVMPIYGSSLKFVHADYAERDIMSLLNYAQERAITDTTAYRFCLDEELRQYWLMRLDEVNGERMFREVTEKQARRRTWSQDVKVIPVKAFEDKHLGASYVQFYPSGACDYGEFDIERADETTTTIKLEGRVGHIEVEE